VQEVEHVKKSSRTRCNGSQRFGNSARPFSTIGLEHAGWLALQFNGAGIDVISEGRMTDEHFAGDAIHIYRIVQEGLPTWHVIPPTGLGAAERAERALCEIRDLGAGFDPTAAGSGPTRA
jgi:hypothetical protein